MSMVSHEVAMTRPSLTFSVEGLSVRDELLVKTFVRLLVTRTEHEWLYQAQPADLRMVAEGVLSKNLVAHSGDQQQALVLGALPSARANYLCMPLRADELLQELNRVGAMITAARPMVASDPTDWNKEPARLLRWPPTSLINTPARMRLATLLTGKPQTLAMLQLRSGQPLADCRVFLSDLERTGLLKGVLAPASPSSHAAQAPAKTDSPVVAPSGLLARIRNRLGIFSGTKS